MSAVNLINKTLEQYAAKVLEDRLYFFLKPHEEKVLKLLLEDGLTKDIKELVGSDLHDAFREYMRTYLEYRCENLVTLNLENKNGNFVDSVITLPEREEKVKKILQKFHYKIEVKE